MPVRIKRTLADVVFHIDINRINTRGLLINMNRLGTWHDCGVIALEMSEPALSEAAVGGRVSRSRKARNYVYTSTIATTTDEQNQLMKIAECLFPNGAGTQSERNNVEIVFNAWKSCPNG